MSEVILESMLVCPVCGFAKRETMPTDSCQFFYECISCKTLLCPKSGDCCVFCSYGSVKCPPNAGRELHLLNSSVTHSCIPFAAQVSLDAVSSSQPCPTNKHARSSTTR